MKVRAYVGDITKATTSAIVNAANPPMLGGGGIDGAIHRAAGPELLKECQKLPQVQPGVRCPVGTAVSTYSYGLPSDIEHIIHTVGPIYPRGRAPMYSGEHRFPVKQADIFLAQAIRSCLQEAERLNILDITFPAISCGVYGCLVAKFASLLREVIRERTWALVQIDVVLFSRTDHDQFKTGWAGRDASELDTLAEILSEQSITP